LLEQINFKDTRNKLKSFELRKAGSYDIIAQL